ncbi:MAG: type III pantothenate kinase [Acidobacteria bacterium]|nr:type III pantothenate kinase [Acidobacteriota bacterium]
MLLAIDLGNTNVVLGVFEGKTIKYSWRIATLRERTSDEYAIIFRGLFSLYRLRFDAVQDIAVCSVVPPLNETITEMARRHFQINPFFVDPMRQDLMPIHYHPPSDVGADRIVNSLAAFQLFGGPAVIVDFGTATTFDAVSAKGEYLGGIIAPGIAVSAEALFARTAKLPRIEIKKPDKAIGDSTVSSMQAGIYLGYVSMVEGMLRRIQKELENPHVIATGGLARLICEGAEGIDRIEENLTLLGLEIFYSRLSGT